VRLSDVRRHAVVVSEIVADLRERDIFRREYVSPAAQDNIVQFPRAES
jgi:hypothetical protein